MTAPVLAQLPGLRLAATPALVQFAELLAVRSADLDARVQAELYRHAPLEMRTPRTCPRCGGTVWRPSAHACLSASSRSVERAEATVEPGQAQALVDALAEVARCHGARGRAVAEHVLADLDDRARLHGGVTAVTTALRVPRDLVEGVLVVLRVHLGAGVAARDLRESLLLQLEARDDAPPLCLPLVAEHLDRLAAGRVDDVAALLGVTVPVVQDALGWVRDHLDAGSPVLPGRRPVVPVLPDLVVSDDAEGDGRLHVRAADAPWQALAVGRGWREHAARDDAVRAAVAAAQSVVDRLSSRATTLVRVAQLAVDRQTPHLRGTGPRQPLTRAATAAELALAESTVSRAVAGTTLLLPDGCARPLAELFAPPGAAVLEALAQLLRGPAPPRSDAALADALAARGHLVARRTVAKYRTQLGVPAQR